MTNAELYFTDASPFARLCRILVIEWNLPVDLIEVSHPLPAAYFENAPMGQVPLLSTIGEKIFPTLPIVEQLWAMTEFPDAPVFDPMEHRQMLSAILAMGDALVVARNVEWAGLEPGSENRLGYDIVERNLARVQHTLDWIEERAEHHAGSVCDYALACILLWSDSRGPIEWRNRPKIAQMVAALEVRPSLEQTHPRPWE